MVPLGMMFDSVVVVNSSNREGREIILGVGVGSTVDSGSEILVLVLEDQFPYTLGLLSGTALT